MAAEGDIGGTILHHFEDIVWVEIPPVLGIDFSITKLTVMVWLAAAACIAVFYAAAQDRRPVPGKFRSFIEAILLYIRDEVARPCMGHAGDRYIPYLWTTFFFILFCNYMGFIPGSMTATANLSVTAGLALISFTIVHLAGIRHHGIVGYLKHFCPPVPKPLMPLMILVEVVSHTTRTVALAVRLFANLMAGHLVILVLLSFILIFKNVGLAVAPFSLIGATLFCCLEVLFGLIQAYVFTLLTAVFIGMALAEEH